jgi:hypothetical protein
VILDFRFAIFDFLLPHWPSAAGQSKIENRKSKILLFFFLTAGVLAAEIAPSKDEVWDAKMAAGVSNRSYLPPAVTNIPRVAEAAKPRPLQLRPAADWPALAWMESDPQARPVLAPAAPPVHLPPLDPAQISRPWCNTPPDAARPDLATDPASVPMLTRTMSSSPELRQKPAPFLRLAIPDPLPPNACLGLQKELPDNVPPAAVTDRSPKPILPTQPQTK